METSQILQKCDHNKVKPIILFVKIGCKLRLIDFTVIPGEASVFLNISACSNIFYLLQDRCDDFDNKEEKCI